MQYALDYFNTLNRDYLAVHQEKETCFWQHYMGIDDDSAAEKFSTTERAYKRFIAAHERLKELRTYIATLESLPNQGQDSQTAALLHGLQGWYRFFDCNVIENPRAQALMDEIIAAESTLHTRRKSYEVTDLNADGVKVAASLGELLTNQAASDNESYRQSSQQALRDLEQWLLHHSFPELITLRNCFARQMGYRNYFDYKVNKTERMTPEQLFAILTALKSKRAMRMHAVWPHWRAKRAIMRCNRGIFVMPVQETSPANWIPTLLSFLGLVRTLD